MRNWLHNKLVRPWYRDPRVRMVFALVALLVGAFGLRLYAQEKLPWSDPRIQLAALGVLGLTVYLAIIGLAENWYESSVRVASSIGESADRAIELVQSANNHIQIVSGSANSDFYVCHGVVAALKNAVSKPVEVDMVVGPNLDPATREALDTDPVLSADSHFRLWQLPTPPPRHFIVADREAVRVEEPHRPFQEDRHSWQWPHNEFLARRLARSFGDLRRDATLVHLGGRPAG